MFKKADSFRKIAETVVPMPTARALQVLPGLWEKDQELLAERLPGLSTRAMNGMCRLEIRTLAELVQLEEARFLTAKWIGKKTTQDVRDLLSEFGLRFGMSKSEWRAYVAALGLR